MCSDLYYVPSSVTSHTVHLPENSTGLHDVAFSACVETKPVCTSFFFSLSDSQAHAEAPTTSPLCSSPRTGHFLGPNVGFALSGNLPFIPRSLHRRFLALVSAPRVPLVTLLGPGQSQCSWGKAHCLLCVSWAELPAKMIKYFVRDDDQVKISFAQDFLVCLKKPEEQ